MLDIAVIQNNVQAVAGMIQNNFQQLRDMERDLTACIQHLDAGNQPPDANRLRESLVKWLRQVSLVRGTATSAINRLGKSRDDLTPHLAAQVKATEAKNPFERALGVEETTKPSPEEAAAAEEAREEAHSLPNVPEATPWPVGSKITK